MAARRDGIVTSFELFWVFDATPLSYRQHGANKIVDFLLHEDEYYTDTCPKLAASVNYTDHTIIISMVNDDVIRYANAGNADSIFDFTIDADKWQQVVENRIGTFEQNKDKINQQLLTIAEEEVKKTLPRNVEKAIKSYLGGKRKSRKTRRRKN